MLKGIQLALLPRKSSIFMLMSGGLVIVFLLVTRNIKSRFELWMAKSCFAASFFFCGWTFFSLSRLTVKVLSLLECLFLPQISLPSLTNSSLSESPLTSFYEEYEKQLGIKLIHNTDHVGSFFALAVAYPSCKV